ncbi:MAG: hypothetical protein AAGA44_05330 [Pseudomonadota bacterium]
MPLQLFLESDLPFAETRYLGAIDDAQLLGFYRGLYRRPEFATIRAELVDLSESDLSLVSGSGLSELAELISDELARIYAAWSELSPEEVRVFRDRDDAIRWLSESGT